MPTRATIRLLLLGGFLSLGVADAHGQSPPLSADSAKRIAIRQVLTAQRTDSTILAGIEVALRNQGTPDPNLPSGFMDAFIARARADIGNVIERLVPVYDSLFTGDEISQMLVFYQTPLGQRMVATQVPLMQAVEQIGGQWGLELAGQVLLDFSKQPRRPD